MLVIPTVHFSVTSGVCIFQKDHFALFHLLFQSHLLFHSPSLCLFEKTEGWGRKSLFRPSARPLLPGLRPELHLPSCHYGGESDPSICARGAIPSSTIHGCRSSEWLPSLLQGTLTSPASTRNHHPAHIFLALTTANAPHPGVTPAASAPYPVLLSWLISLWCTETAAQEGHHASATTVCLCPLIILLTVTFLILQGRGSIDLQSHQLHPRKALVTLLWVTSAKVGEFTSFLRRVHDPLQPLSTSSCRRQVMF